MSEETKITFDVVELQKISLKPGDVLLFKLKSNDIDDETLQNFKKSMQSHFPNNLVMGVAIPIESDIIFEAVTQEAAEEECCGGGCHTETEGESNG